MMFKKSAVGRLVSIVIFRLIEPRVLIRTFVSMFKVCPLTPLVMIKISSLWRPKKTERNCFLGSVQNIQPNEFAYINTIIDSHCNVKGAYSVRLLDPGQTFIEQNCFPSIMTSMSLSLMSVKPLAKETTMSSDPFVKLHALSSVSPLFILNHAITSLELCHR